MSSKFFVTFPQRLPEVCDGWHEITAPDLATARRYAWQTYGNDWSNISEESEFRPNQYPKGCLKRINLSDQVAEHPLAILDKVDHPWS